MSGKDISLRKRSLSSVFWLVSDQGVSSVLRLTSNLILTRLLIPEAFGLLALVQSIIFGLSMMSDVGTSSVLVQDKDGEKREFLATVFSMNILRGIFVWILCLIFASSVALLSDTNAAAKATITHEMFPILLAVGSFTMVLYSCESVLLHIDARNVDLRRGSILALGSHAIGTLFMVGTAVIWPSPWALIIGNFATHICSLIGSHLLFPSRFISPGWDVSIARRVFSKSKWILVSSMSTFVMRKGDIFIFGFVLNAQTMGMYSVSMALVDVLRNVFSRIQYRIGLAAMSEVFRERPETFSKNFYRLRMAIEIPAFFCGSALSAVGPTLISIMYDDRYLEAGSILQIVALNICLVTYEVGFSGLNARGSFKLTSLIRTIRTVLILIGLPLSHSAFGFSASLSYLVLVNIPIYLILIAAIYRQGWLNLIREIIFLPLVPLGYGFGLMLVLFVENVFGDSL